MNIVLPKKALVVQWFSESIDIKLRNSTYSEKLFERDSALRFLGLQNFVSALHKKRIRRVRVLRVCVGTMGRKVFGLKRMPGNAEAWKRLGHAWTEMKELSLETIIQF